MLYDKEFLLKLDKYKHKTIYAKITALSFDENPIETIEGRVTQGSINIDGASAVRRSCSLTISAPDFQYNNYYWGLNTKFKLEIGVRNYIDSTYPDIIWFNQGIYLITTFNTSRNTNSLNITLQGKDKMCLLNGEVGGSLESPVDFGTIEEESDNGLWTIRQIPIYEIIQNIVHIYGKEPYHNIIIKDLDSCGLELLEYRYDTPIYLYREKDSNIFDNVLFETDVIDNFYFDYECSDKIESLAKLDSDHLDKLISPLVGVEDPEPVYYKPSEGAAVPYIFAKISAIGETAGYKMTDLVYAGDLIANVGDSITSVLDKIKTMLTEFEYFYNLDGQFVFQKKQSFKETIWNFGSDEIAQNSIPFSDKVYEFYNNNLITAFNNNPNLLNLKNDYSIWGEREGISGIKIPVHLRYAIDKKPLKYTRITVDANDLEAINNYNQKYGTHINTQSALTFKKSDSYQEVDTTIFCDWREIIFQMAKDYYTYGFLDDFELKVAAANPIDYSTGRTGYEQYYVDIYSLWRDLYYPKYENLFSADGKIIAYSQLQNEIRLLTRKVYGTTEVGDQIQYKNNIGGIESDLIAFNNGDDNYRRDLMAYWSSSNGVWTGTNSGITVKPTELEETTFPKYVFKIINASGNLETVTDSSLYLSCLKDYFFQEKARLEDKIYYLEQQEKKYSNYKPTDYYTNGDHKYWNTKVFEYPDQINFWFDFLDTPGELSQFSVQSIGSRPKVVNDTNIKSIYFRETPSVIYGTNSSIVNEEGLRYIQAADLEHMFHISPQGKSAKNKLDELIYQHSYCIESATITSVPIYYLEPNTRIYLHDDESGLDGDYIVSKITLPLTYNGTMSITATKAVNSII